MPELPYAAGNPPVACGSFFRSLPALVFCWKLCRMPIWNFIGNCAACLFGILLETVLHPYLVFYWKSCCTPIWNFIGNRATSLYRSHLSEQGMRTVRILELNKAIER